MAQSGHGKAGTKRGDQVIAFALGIVTALAVQAQQKNGGVMKLTPQDYIDIQQLVNRYAHEIDMCVDNGYSYADMYAPDGVFIDLFSDIRTCREIDEVRESRCPKKVPEIARNI